MEKLRSTLARWQHQSIHCLKLDAIHLTSEEYLAKSGTTKKIDVQAEME